MQMKLTITHQEALAALAVHYARGFDLSAERDTITIEISEDRVVDDETYAVIGNTGRKIAAIKLYRALNRHASLIEAKEFVEKMMRQYPLSQAQA